MKKSIAMYFLAVTFVLSLIVNLFVEISSNLNNVMASPSSAHWFGTDSIGRDIFLRVLQGFGTSIAVGGLALLLSMLLGLFLGGLAGWFGSWVDLIIMRLTDFFDGLPDLLLAIVILLSVQAAAPAQSTLSSLLLLAFSLGVVGWTRLARQTRALVLQEKSKGYTLSATVVGAGTFRILVKHLWPNIRRPMLRFSLMHFPGFVLFEGSLSFFGLGLKQPATSLGLLLQEGWRTISIAPHLVWAPALFLFLTLLSFESLGRFEKDLRFR